MFTVSQLTIKGYLGDGFILCRKCGENRNMPMDKGLTEYELESTFGEDGLYCDSCTEEIVEPCPDEETDDEA